LRADGIGNSPRPATSEIHCFSDRVEERDCNRAYEHCRRDQRTSRRRPSHHALAQIACLSAGRCPVSRVLVTGGTGFIGRALCPMLLNRGLRVSVATRSPRVAETISGVDVRAVPGIGPGVDWSVALRDVGAIVHLAARIANEKGEQNRQLVRDLQRVNVEGARKLAEDAAVAGVRRIIYVSSASIHGAHTEPDQSFRESDPAAPADLDSRIKWEAEQALAEVAGAGDLELFILRPPMVYGPRVKGDFLALLRRIEKARLLAIAGPGGGILNRRSLLYVENLCDAIVCCLATSEAAGGTFLVRDDETLSTAEILRSLARAMMRDPRVVQVPRPLLPIAARLAGNGSALDCIGVSFCIDDGAIRQQLGWTPPCSVVEGFDATVAWFGSSSH
jgi:nucleoside-diphosphate-sugar epimerase